MREKLPYVDCVAKKIVTSAGYVIYEGADEAYRGVKLRNKVVFKYDMLHYLINTVFSQKTYDSYRDALMQLCTNNIDKDQISRLLLALYKCDSTFSMMLNEIYHFDERLDSLTFLDCILYRITMTIQKARDHCLENASGKILFESALNLYYSKDINDADNIVEVENLKLEVLTVYAKNRPPNR